MAVLEERLYEHVAPTFEAQEYPASTPRNTPPRLDSHVLLPGPTALLGVYGNPGGKRSTLPGCSRYNACHTT